MFYVWLTGSIRSPVLSSYCGFIHAWAASFYVYIIITLNLFVNRLSLYDSAYFIYWLYLELFSVSV